MKNTSPENIRHNPKSGAIFGATLMLAGSALYLSEGYTERSYESALAPSIETFVRDAETIQSSLIMNKQELIQDRIDLEKTIGTQCLIFLSTPTVRSSLSEPPCNAGSEQIAEYRSQLNNQKTKEKNIAKSLSLVDPLGKNMGQTKFFLKDASNTSIISDLIDGPFFRANSIELLHLDQKGIVRAGDTLEVPTTVRTRTIIASMLIAASIALLTHASQLALRRRLLINRFKKDLQTTTLTVERFKPVVAEDNH